MDETIFVMTIEGRLIHLTRCEEKLHDFCEVDAYKAFDRIASTDDVVTRPQLDAVNDAMKARTPVEVWTKFLAPNSIPHLSLVPKEIDLIDSDAMPYALARERIRSVYETLACEKFITDMAASKVCYLKRPKLVAISDGYVRAMLVGPDENIDPQDPDRGRKYAIRGVAVMDAVRCLGQFNAKALRVLHQYSESLRIEGQAVRLTKARILDILLWIEVASTKDHPYWGSWGQASGSAKPPAPTPPTTQVHPAESTVPPGTACPLCNGAMIWREGPKGPFLGCVRYPECKGTRSLAGAPDSTAVPCPKCGAQMVRRTGPKAPFFGCVTYPKCNGTRTLDEVEALQGSTATAVEGS